MSFLQFGCICTLKSDPLAAAWCDLFIAALLFAENHAEIANQPKRRALSFFLNCVWYTNISKILPDVSERQDDLNNLLKQEYSTILSSATDRQLYEEVYLNFTQNASNIEDLLCPDAIEILAANKQDYLIALCHCVITGAFVMKQEREAAIYQCDLAVKSLDTVKCPALTFFCQLTRMLCFFGLCNFQAAFAVLGEAAKSSIVNALPNLKTTLAQLLTISTSTKLQTTTLLYGIRDVISALCGSDITMFPFYTFASLLNLVFSYLPPLPFPPSSSSPYDSTSSVLCDPYQYLGNIREIEKSPLNAGISSVLQLLSCFMFCMHKRSRLPSVALNSLPFDLQLQDAEAVSRSFQDIYFHASQSIPQTYELMVNEFGVPGCPGFKGT